MGFARSPAVFAAAVGATLLLVCGASAQDEVRIVQNPPPQGRYALYFGPFTRADTFLLDTQTGKVWKRVKYTDIVGEPAVWRWEDRIDKEQQDEDWDKRHPLKPSVAKDREWDKRYRLEHPTQGGQ